MNFTVINRSFLFISLVIFSTVLKAQFPPPDGGGGGTTTVSISGASTANINESKTYSVSASGGTHHYSNYTVSGGSITSQSKTSVTVKWTSGGNGRWVKVTAGVGSNTETATKYVTVSGSCSMNTYSVTGGGSLCSGSNGVSVGLSDSQSGINYKLYRNGSYIKTKSGTGGSLNFGNQTSAGTYTVVATKSGCSNRTMSGSATVTVYSRPVSYSVQGGGSYCSGGTGKSISLSDSQNGVNYKLYRGSTYVKTVAGTGSSLNFGNQTAAGTYTVKATNSNNCTRTMSGSKSISIIALPTVYSVQGGGSYCSGGGGKSITLSDSQNGVDYKLYRTGSLVKTVTGTGSSISFGNQTVAGTYTVLAINPNGCTKPMSGSKSVSVINLPIVYSVQGGGSYCSGGNGKSISLSDSQSGVDYELYRGSTYVKTVAGTGTSINFGNQTAAGTYTVQAINSGGCTRTMSGSKSVSIDDLPTTYTVQGGGGYCSGGSGRSISLSDSQSGVDYKLYLDGAYVKTVSGTGSSINFGNQTIAGTYTVEALNSGGCNLNMDGSAWISIITNSTPVVLSTSYSLDGATITRDAPPLGETWYWQSGPTETDTLNSSITKVATQAGTYYLRGRTDSGCWSAAVPVTILANEPETVTTTAVSHGAVLVEWSGTVGNETGFKVKRANESDGIYNLVYTANGSQSEYLDISLEPETNYLYKVQAVVGSQKSSALQASPVETPMFDGDDTLSHEPLYNGNISAMRWKGPNDEAEQLYTFGYDGLNRLKSAHYATRVANAYEGNKGHYSVPSIDYDLNGNISGLVRQGRTEEGNAAIIDELSYSYGVGSTNQSNQLLSVTDARGASGFNDGNTSGDDYTYDPNGNMTKDRNKDIDSIYYNHLNLPVKVEFETAGDSIIYLYDAAGIKLKQTVYEAGDTVKVTDYVGEFIYEADSVGERKLQLIQHEEGRIVPIPGLVPGSSEGWDYQYHLKDHLGNVRVTFSTTPENYTIVEDFENGGDKGFQDLNIQSKYLKNTTQPYPNFDKVNQLSSNTTGVMLFLSMNKGDTVHLSVNAGYAFEPSSNTFLGTSYGLLFSAFDNAYGLGTEGGVASSSTTFDDALNGTQMATKSNSTLDPRVYLNYIFFDKDMNFVRAGFDQMTTEAMYTTAHSHETLSIPNIIADQEGYLLTYLSNENAEDLTVNFDDFTIYHGKTNVVSTQDYYPFGLTFNESVRVASTVNRFKYNSFEFMDDLNLNLYDYQARYYDPAIGRFIQVDPAADLMRRHSPYNYAFDNPIRYIDPDGMMGQDVVDGPCGSEPCPEEEQKQDTQEQEQEPDQEGKRKKGQGTDYHTKGQKAQFDAIVEFFNGGDGEEQIVGRQITSEDPGPEASKNTAKNFDGEQSNDDGSSQIGKSTTSKANAVGSVTNFVNSLLGLTQEFGSGSNVGPVATNNNSSNQVNSDDVQITPTSDGGEIHTRRISYGSTGKASVEKYKIVNGDTTHRSAGNGAYWVPYKQNK